MPVRLPAFSFAASVNYGYGQVQRRLFQSSSVRREGNGNHYKTLNIPIDATPAEVKKSFYALSKTHHPDLNPTDPNASSRFVQISDAYATLSIPAKRQAYDRDFIHASQPHSTPHHPHHKGSYSSSNPAGGRPASGLSRRRTQFRGPPPSFYRSGGWGKHGEKREKAQGHGAPGAEKPDFGEDVNSTGGSGGMGPGQMGWGHGNDVPHFDKESHFRTHQGYERRRRERMKRGFGEGVEEDLRPSGMLGQFFLLGGLLFVCIVVPTVVFGRVNRVPDTKKDEK